MNKTCKNFKKNNQFLENTSIKLYLMFAKYTGMNLTFLIPFKSKFYREEIKTDVGN